VGWSWFLRPERRANNHHESIRTNIEAYYLSNDRQEETRRSGVGCEFSQHGGNDTDQKHHQYRRQFLQVAELRANPVWQTWMFCCISDGITPTCVFAIGIGHNDDFQHFASKLYRWWGYCPMETSSPRISIPKQLSLMVADVLQQTSEHQHSNSNDYLHESDE